MTTHLDMKRSIRATIALLALTIASTAFTQVDFDETGTQINLDGAFGDNRAIRFADMDADGDLDVVVGRWGSPFRIWLNDSNGSYSNSEFDGDEGADRINGLLVENFDDDGLLDIMAVRGGGQSSRLWLSDGDGGLSLSPQEFPGESHAAVGDLDGDSDADVVFGNGDVYINNGAGQFSELTNLDGGGSVDIGDLDGDGHVDILFAGAATGSVYFNNGNTPPDFGAGNFEPVTGNRSTELVDLDGDNDLDAVTNAGAYLNDGNGGFSESQTWIGDVIEATAADVDQDGDMDIALALRGPGISDIPNEIWVNDGSASFNDSGLSLGNNFASAAAFGDCDGDSDPDLIFGASNSDYVYLHENLGDPWLIFRDRFEDETQIVQ